MGTPGSSGGAGPGNDDSALIDRELLQRLLLVANAALVYRDRLQAYLAKQAEYVEEGRTLDDLVAVSWEQFEGVAWSERHLFAALDDLERLPWFES